MPLTNSEWCDGVHNTTNCCQRMAQPIYQCKGIEYENFCEDENFFESLNLWFEIPIDIIDVILSIMIILISIYGKINGTFKWCIMNIAILHLLYPIFSRFIARQAIAPHCRSSYCEWGWSKLAAGLFMTSFLAIGTQGVTTSIAGSLPLALNRFALTHQTRLYAFFFGTGKRSFWFLLLYDLIMFGIFYTCYQLSTLNDLKVLTFNYIIYYTLTISLVVIANSLGLILMIFVLYRIYSSVIRNMKLDQRQMLQERKRIAWIILAQSLVNFFLCASRIVAFYNVSLDFGGFPTIMCYNPYGNFYNAFSYVFQELLVCLDCVIYLFLLTPYREQLFRYFGTGRAHAVVVSTGSQPRVDNLVK